MALREQKRLQTRAALFDAAVTLFVARGYDGTTMDDIAELAMVSRATAFTYFPKKEDLLLEWAMRRREAAAGPLQRDGVDGDLERGDPAQIKQTVLALATSYARDKAGRTFVLAWLSTGSPLRDEAWASADVLTELVQAGQAAGRIRPDVNAGVAGRLLLNVYLGSLYQWAAQGRSGAWLKRELEQALDSIFGGLTLS